MPKQKGQDKSAKKKKVLTPAEQQKKWDAMVERLKKEAQIESSRRKVPRRGKKVLTTTSSFGIVGHHYTGKEYLGKNHGTIHKAIGDTVMTDLVSNKKVTGVSTNCDQALTNASKKQDDQDYIEHFEDSDGRTVVAIGRIAPDPEPDKKATTPDPKGGINTIVDDRGHLLPEKGVSANAVNEANKTKNVVAENWLINQHYKKAFEDTVKKYAIAHPDKVVMTMHEPHYKTGELRPYEIVHYVIVDKEVVCAFTFDNPPDVIETRAT